MTKLGSNGPRSSSHWTWNFEMYAYTQYPTQRRAPTVAVECAPSDIGVNHNQIGRKLAFVDAIHVGADVLYTTTSMIVRTIFESSSVLSCVMHIYDTYYVLRRPDHRADGVGVGEPKSEPAPTPGT